MASNKIKINDIARLAGVSATTVSHIFNKHDKKFRISPETRQKVLNIAEQFKEQPHIRQYITKANNTNTIGVIVPDMSNHFFSMFLHYLELSFQKKNIQLLITCSHYNPDNEIKVAQNLVERKVDALIVVTSLSCDRFYVAINRSIPVLFFDRYLTNTPLPFITSESLVSVENLISKQAKHFNEFYFIGCDIELTSIAKRLQGFKQGLIKADIAVQPEWIITDNYASNKGYNLIKQLHHSLKRIPEAIFTASGNVLQEVLAYLVEIKVKPDTIYLATYDYNDYLDYCQYPIDAIVQDYASMTQTCIEITDKLLNFKPLKTNSFFIDPKIKLHQNHRTSRERQHLMN